MQHLAALLILTSIMPFSLDEDVEGEHEVIAEELQAGQYGRG